MGNTVVHSYQWSVVDGVRVQRHLGLPSGQRAGHKRRTPPDQRSPSLKAVSPALPPLLPLDQQACVCVFVPVCVCVCVCVCGFGTFIKEGCVFLHKNLSLATKRRLYNTFPCLVVYAIIIQCRVLGYPPNSKRLNSFHHRCIQ